MIIKEIAKKSPYFIQRPIRSIYGIIPYYKKLGKIFKNTYDFLGKSQYWNKEQLEQYQVEQLKNLLVHSYNNVPYYCKLFNECGFNVEKFKYLDDIDKIPFLTKDLVMKNTKDLMAKNFKKSDFIYSSTGGTTGKQMRFFTQKNFSASREWAFMITQWSRIGFDYKNSRRIILRNQVLPKGRLWIWDNCQRSLVVDTYHLTDENIKKIIDRLNYEKNPYIHTYPSAVAIICDYIKRTGYGLTYDLKGVLASSENIYVGQRELIESTLNTRMFSWYGHSEQCILAGECERSNKYHIFSEYGYTELIDNKGNVIRDNGIKGELVGTSFNNYVMPFIRYKTEDYACYSQDQNCKCGRNYKLLDSVEGRWLQEMIITSKGNKISITAMNMHSDIFDNVKNFQFYQDTPGVCIINIVKKSSYTVKDENVIYRELSKKLGNDVILKFNYVNNIERTKGGKYRFLIQKIKT
ncbi:phenylacetate--CoA ligase family protein [Clostridium coskatii]|uniref:Phenylacetate-coenzyme A ligase n=1 Tax=Clostridium coskatii TaxID=1705578 RepID=A0A170NNW8_9CLOT|nr:phenylacetate--CoA ligase family protein [Clostridium coskatii]OAA94198.1 Phenylacetate-coenzyme A ligase [Clostridium coskatii]OBR95532.1 phenylacetate-coenzyme A ligase [Clostridium coskatii]